MGLGCCFWSSVVPSQYTVPGNLYSKNDRIDRKKLRRLINDGKLAPLFPGCEEAIPPPEHDQYVAILTRLLRRGDKRVDAATLKEHMQLLGQAYEACPICFLHYPALNTSRCCFKRVCTECYLQVQTARAGVPACPFCKVANYSAKFSGLKSGEEREQERVEEQKVIEARIREREEEMRRDLEREQQREQQRRQPAAAGGGAGGSALPAAAGTPVGITAASGAAATLSLPAGGLLTAVVPSSPTASSDTWQSAAESRSPTHAQQQQGVIAPATRNLHDHPHGNSAQARGMSPSRMRHRPGQQGHHHDSHGRGAGQYANTRAQHHHAQGAGNAGVYRWADYVPMGVVHMGELGVEDINDLMLEQAMYESAAASASPATASAAVATSIPQGGLPASVPAASAAHPQTSTADRQGGRLLVHQGGLSIPAHQAESCAGSSVSGVPASNVAVLESSDDDTPSTLVRPAATAVSNLAPAPNIPVTSGAQQPATLHAAAPQEHVLDSASILELPEHEQLELAIKLSLADTSKTMAGAAGSSAAGGAGNSGSSSSSGAAAQHVPFVPQPVNAAVVQGVPVMSASHGTHSLLGKQAGVDEGLTSKRGWQGPVLGMPALRIPVDSDQGDAASSRCNAEQIPAVMPLQREHTPDTPISPHLPLVPRKGSCTAAGEPAAYDKGLTSSRVGQRPGHNYSSSDTDSSLAASAAQPGQVHEHARAGPVAEGTECCSSCEQVAYTWLIPSCQASVNNAKGQACLNAMDAATCQRRDMAADLGTPRISATSLAAIMPQTMHLGMAFVVWDPDVPTATTLPTARPAVTPATCTHSVQAIASTHTPMLLVQNPDGSSVCAVSEAFTPLQATLGGQQQLQQDEPDQVAAVDAQFDVAAAQLLAAQDQAVSSELQAIEAAGYADYDIPGLNARDDEDALLTAHIMATDMQLKQAYSSGC